MLLLIPRGLVEWMRTTPRTAWELLENIMELVAESGVADTSHVPIGGYVSWMVPQGQNGKSGNRRMQYISSYCGAHVGPSNHQMAKATARKQPGNRNCTGLTVLDTSNNAPTSHITSNQHTGRGNGYKNKGNIVRNGNGGT